MWPDQVSNPGLLTHESGVLTTALCGPARVYRVFWDRLASFGQLGLNSDPQISSKFQNGINDPKGLENKIYTMMKGRETFNGDHTVQITSVPITSSIEHLFSLQVTSITIITYCKLKNGYCLL